MVRLKTDKNIPKTGNILLLAELTCDFKHYGLTAEDIAYIRQQTERKAEQIAIRKGVDWTLVQIVDATFPENKGKEKIRCGASAMHAIIQQQNIQNITIINTVGNNTFSLSFAEGLVLTAYQFLKYVGRKDERQFSLQEVTLTDVSPEQTNELVHLLTAVYKTRDLINEPANVMTSVRLAQEMQGMAQEAGLQVQVLDKTAIEKLQMGGILAVNRGSVEAPTFTILEWHPAEAQNTKPVVLVGKGLVYDTGGHSLKPTEHSMDSMKCDMSGGAAVAATLYAVAKAKLPVYVVGLVPSTDNRLSASAYSPGDIITMYDGTTVEVLNTDAEGRLILADALTYAKKYHPELVIDIATLTGSAHRAIGENALIGMGNAPQETMNRMKASGDAVHERIAEFPFWDDYAKSLESDIADLKNVGGELAGAITAGKFLEHFTDYPYIHLDIAGTAFLQATDNYRIKGGTGAGVRLLFDFLKKYHN
ncbi:MAG: leucyl aminopeptidase [Bacteroidales bacterium]|jgi:leucyl aminopeptidase|nr:leucyl aminopeptidase [Bacteroidales bacterium]